MPRNVERRQRVDQARPAEGFAQSGWGIRQVRVTVVPLTLRSAKAPPGGVAVVVRLLCPALLVCGSGGLVTYSSATSQLFWAAATIPHKPPGRRDPGRFSFCPQSRYEARQSWAGGGCRKAVSVVWTLVVVVATSMLALAYLVVDCPAISSLLPVHGMPRCASVPLPP